MKKTITQKSKWITVLIVIIILWLIGSIIAGIIGLFIGADQPVIGDGNVAIIKVTGIITGEKRPGLFGESAAVSPDVINLIEEAEKNPNMKAILLEINSPGGSAVASEEIANAIKKSNKTSVALIREVGASGGYWVASSADHVIASRMSITGSVGVIAAYLEVSGLLERYNITYQRMVSGKYKDIGSPFKELSEEEEAIFQEQLDLIHQFFIDEVVKNRNIEEKNIEEVSSGAFFVGSKAKELGLVDELGGKEEALSYIEKELNITAKPVTYEKPKTFFEVLAGTMNEFSFYVGRGIGNSLVNSEPSTNVKLIT